MLLPRPLVMLWTCAAMACAATPTPTTTAPAATCPPSTSSEPTGTTAEAERTPHDPLADITLAPRPAWADRYAETNAGDMRFFDIAALMSKHGLTRDRAVELQNHYRDLSRSDPGGTPSAHFDAALARAVAGEFEDRRDVAALAKARFIVVFDLDDTLYDQFYDAAAAGCHDLEVEHTRPKPLRRKLELAPGAAAALDRIAALGGAIVIFSAYLDEPTVANLRAWQFGGKPLPDHPAIAGVLTNSHLVLQPRKDGTPVVEPAKDLRILDETLTRVILVDDNPLRTFQPRNVRVTHKFDATRYCTTKDAKLRKLYERTLPTVVAEIEESLRYATDNDVDFARAYLPYSQIGGVATRALRSGGMSERAAIAFVRTHPEIVESEF